MTHDEKNEEEYEYVCSDCNTPVSINDKICPGCKESLAREEINYKELEDILSRGPDKAYTLLYTFYENGEKYKVIALGELLIKRYPDSKQAKRASDIIEKEKQHNIIANTDKKGSLSLFNFRRTSTKLAFLVGLPIYVYLIVYLGWGKLLALMISVLPVWIIFSIVEIFYFEKKKIQELSDVELKVIASAEFKEHRAFAIRIAKDEAKERGLDSDLYVDANKRTRDKKQKGIKLFLLILIGCLMFITPSDVFSTEWLLVGIHPQENIKLYLDIDSVKQKGKEVFFWQKGVYESGEYALTEAAVNCTRNDMWQIQLIFYSSNGSITKRFNFKETGQVNKSVSIPPESHVSTLYSFFCKEGKPQPSKNIKANYYKWLNSE